MATCMHRFIEKQRFKENSGIFARIFTKKWIKVYFFRAGCTLMSRIETRASSLIIFLIFVDFHKQRIITVDVDTNVH